ncbi:MAG: hypothetical protein ACRD4B_00365 [Acidobacteriota bacterium]
MSKFRSHLVTSFRMRIAGLGESEVATGEDIIAKATIASGLPLMAAQNAMRQEGAS